MRNSLGTHVTAAAVGTALMFAAPASRAIEIVIENTGGLSGIQFQNYLLAAEMWEAVLLDPITVTINGGWSSANDPPLGALGKTRTVNSSYDSEAVLAAMWSDAGSFAERQAVSTIAGWSASGGLTLPSDPVPIPVRDINGERVASEITLTAANAKALGLIPGQDPIEGSPLDNGADAEIIFNHVFEDSFDFNPLDGIDSDKVDFLTTVMHEMGHVLGFASGTFRQDWNPDAELRPYALDLFRFAATGNPHDLANEARQMTAGPAEYYDPEIGNHEMAWGKGIEDPQCDANMMKCEASHWRTGTLGLMAPAAGPGPGPELTAKDLQALDLVGYDLTPWKLSPLLNIDLTFFDYGQIDLPPEPPDIFDPYPILPPELIDVLHATGYTLRSDALFNKLTPYAASPVPTRFGIRLGMGFGETTLGLRSAVGFVEMFEPFANPDALVRDDGPVDPIDMNLFPAGPPLVSFPWRIGQFSFVTEDSAGAQFAFYATVPEHGAYFDESLGEFGGFRISGFIDAFGDGIIGDMDARMTFLLLAAGPDPFGTGSAAFFLQQGALDNHLIMLDEAAFGLAVPEPGTWSLLLAALLLVRRSR